MAKYYVQVLYIKYIEVEAESEIEAEFEANEKIEQELEQEPMTTKDLTFTVTDKIN